LETPDERLQTWQLRDADNQIHCLGSGPHNAGGVPDVLHAFSLHHLLIGDPVVCGAPATIRNASGVKTKKGRQV